MHDLKCGEKHADKFRLAITTSEGMTLFYLRSVVAAMRIFVKIFPFRYSEKADAGILFVNFYRTVTYLSKSSIFLS